jgi:hypothetical protein
MIHLAVASAVIVLLIAASGSGDYELVVLDNEWAPICVKTEHMCNEARAAIIAGRSFLAAPNMQTLCVPHPDCFPKRSNCIEGFNCR